jgi:hypothetical protein
MFRWADAGCHFDPTFYHFIRTDAIQVSASLPVAAAFNVRVAAIYSSNIPGTHFERMCGDRSDLPWLPGLAATLRIVTPPRPRSNAPSIKSKPAFRHGSGSKKPLR